MTAKKYETLEETQVKKALDEKYMPNDETIRAMEESIANEGQGEVVDASEFSVFDFHKKMLKEIENENKA